MKCLSSHFSIFQFNQLVYFSKIKKKNNHPASKITQPWSSPSTRILNKNVFVAINKALAPPWLFMREIIECGIICFQCRHEYSRNLTTVVSKSL